MAHSRKKKQKRRLFRRASMVVALDQQKDHLTPRKEKAMKTAPCLGLLLLLFISASRLEPARQTITYSSLSQFMHDSLPGAGLEPWRKRLRSVKTVAITASSDRAILPGLWYAPDNKKQRPLLIVLHCWNSDYTQTANMPYAQWALSHDWIFMQPTYRGMRMNGNASHEAYWVRDVLDAVDYARENAAVDPERIYLVGRGGAGMTALALAGKRPDLWAAVVAWAPVYSLTAWYPHTIAFGDRFYRERIRLFCGGNPLRDSAAARACYECSPEKYLPFARDQVQIFLGHGIHDATVPVTHSIRAFNALASGQRTIADHLIDRLERNTTLPADLTGSFYDSAYTAAGAKLRYCNASRNTVLHLYEGGHDCIYRAGLQWLSRQSRMQ